eukprot:CAMPEP_0203677140 /NCGR_PEP_ID=MMETSP0090-20130426/27168_1 /ASSEMBLY_ACC=CAM_ASM_001088 /TAXON_ID=426623 /ORGANISM="Chaetoceros affinis, Strain CCMP159" /LENGTH=500 /DNA_ID=CAMNT_0050543935 /DNA_START=173 /DNA_END=1675 /DNA_ORIENTATION=-
MSRRRGEFEHRTSIFEGAYRAWSHLAGCKPEDLLTLPASELDPLINPHDPKTDPRNAPITSQKEEKTYYEPWPYEPLPRAGIVHPFVQSIITPWLGPDADRVDIHQGLSTLRTWWQHRKKGESSSAKHALAAPKMNGVVDGYLRHFFNLAHYLTLHKHEQPPKSLIGKLPTFEDAFSETASQSARNEQGGTAVDMERRKEQELRHQEDNQIKSGEKRKSCTESGETFPIVCNAGRGKYCIVLDMQGSDTSCNYCNQITELMIRGVHGFGLPSIPGLCGALAGKNTSSVLIIIDDISVARRVSNEVCDMLRGAGYSKAAIRGINLVEVMSQLTSKNDGQNATAWTLEEVTKLVIEAFQEIDQSTKSRKIEIDLNYACSCFDDTISNHCSLHSQINASIFSAFDNRKGQVLKLLLTGINTLCSYKELPSSEKEEKDYDIMEKNRSKKQQKMSHSEDNLLEQRKSSKSHQSLSAQKRQPCSSPQKLAENGDDDKPDTTYDCYD